MINIMNCSMSKSEHAMSKSETMAEAENSTQFRAVLTKGYCSIVLAKEYANWNGIILVMNVITLYIFCNSQKGY